MFIPHKLVASVIHLRLSNPPASRMDEEELLQDICDEALRSDLFIARSRYNETDEPPASIRLCVCRLLSSEQLLRSAEIIKLAAAKVFSVAVPPNGGHATPSKKIAAAPSFVNNNNGNNNKHSSNGVDTPRRSTRLGAKKQ
jgi:hypothetical protein